MHFITHFVRIVLLFAVAAYAAPVRPGVATLRAFQAAATFRGSRTFTKGDVVHVKPKDAVPKLDVSKQERSQPWSLLLTLLRPASVEDWFKTSRRSDA